MSESWRNDVESSAKRGYGSRWQKARESYLKRNPLCVYCAKQHKVVSATVLDHIIPHRGDKSLFWDKHNWQALCKPCHDSVKQQLEKSGTVKGCDLNGIPIDAGHHWNRKGG